MRNECQFVLVRRQNSQQWDGGITSIISCGLELLSQSQNSMMQSISVKGAPSNQLSFEPVMTEFIEAYMMHPLTSVDYGGHTLKPMI